jgi:Spy/CpxP family protein refolding chaperone
MKSVYTAAASLVMLVLLAGVATAQRPEGKGRAGGGGMRMMGLGGLLMNESVQEELKLSDDQIAKIQGVVPKVQRKHAQEFAQLRNLSPSERHQKGSEMMKAFNDEIFKGLGDTLKPDQIKRLKEIDLQEQGARAFADPEIATALKLTDAQKEKIKSINDDFMAEMSAARQGGPGQIAQLRKQSMKKISEVLTEEQQKTWHEMTGKPFEIKRIRPGA